MKQQERKKPRPSERMKKRYILFQCDEKHASFSSVKQSLFSLGIKPLKLIEFNAESGNGIVRCERSKAAALGKALNQAGFKTVKTSGSVKKLFSIA